MASSNPNRNISRAVSRDADGNQKAAGWLVRFTRAGETYQAFFGDSRHGGQRKALAAARLDRDAQLPKFDKIALTAARQRVADLASAVGKKKVTGVRWVTRHISKGKKKYAFESATSTWLDADGKRCTASFAVMKHGKKDAWRLACEARAKGLRDRLRKTA